MEQWKDTIITLAAGLVGVSSLIQIIKFFTGRDNNDVLINIYNPDKVEVPQEKRVIDLAMIASGGLEREPQNDE